MKCYGSRARNGRRDSAMIYMCDGTRGCTGRGEARVDDLVAAVVIGRLSQPDALDWLLGDDEQARRLAQRCEESQRRLDDAADSQADGKITIRATRTHHGSLLRRSSRQPNVSVTRRFGRWTLQALRPLAGPEAADRWAGNVGGCAPRCFRDVRHRGSTAAAREARTRL